MLDIAESILNVTALVLMLISLAISFVPFVPGTILVWGIGLAHAILTGFEPVTVLAVAVMTLLMIAGSTSDIWMQFFGVRTGGGSCLSAAGSIVGGIAGTFLIPIPILGTVIGTVAGAALTEFIRRGQLDIALEAGSTAFRLYVWGVVVEFTASLAIVIVFIVSVWG
jgi:uncharacterized protein YqgC (DUF456 family)